VVMEAGECFREGRAIVCMVEPPSPTNTQACHVPDAQTTSGGGAQGHSRHRKRSAKRSIPNPRHSIEGIVTPDCQCERPCAVRSSIRSHRIARDARKDVPPYLSTCRHNAARYGHPGACWGYSWVNLECASPRVEGNGWECESPYGKTQTHELSPLAGPGRAGPPPAAAVRPWWLLPCRQPARRPHPPSGPGPPFGDPRVSGRCRLANGRRAGPPGRRAARSAGPGRAWRDRTRDVQARTCPRGLSTHPPVSKINPVLKLRPPSQLLLYHQSSQILHDRAGIVVVAAVGERFRKSAKYPVFSLQIRRKSGIYR
jgi:hypothetical protein